MNADQLRGRTFWRETQERWPWLLAYIAAVLLAAYTGFRLPSLYTMTLYNVSISDGAYRRGLFGSLLSPLLSVTNYRYGVMALVSFAFLGGLLLVAFWAVVRARWDAQRLLIVVWFVSPAGGYFFHEVGYTDQVIYLLFVFSAIAVVKRKILVATVIATFSVLIHELSLFTTVPLLVLLVLIRVGWTSRLVLFALPVFVGGLLALAPMMNEDQVGATGAKLRSELPFEIRMDAIALFGRSLSQTWALEYYSPMSGFYSVSTFLVIAVVATAVGLWRLEPGWQTGVRVGVSGAALVAVVLPFMLVFFGWDFHRWRFLGLANFLIVTLILWQSASRKISIARLGLGLAPVLLIFYAPMNYFDGYFPRPLTQSMFERILYSPHTEFLGFPDDRL